MLHHRKVVRNEQVGQAQPVLQPDHQADDARRCSRPARRSARRRPRNTGSTARGTRERDVSAGAGRRKIREEIVPTAAGGSPTRFSSSPRARRGPGGTMRQPGRVAVRPGSRPPSCGAQRGIRVLKDHLHPPAQRSDGRLRGGEMSRLSNTMRLAVGSSSRIKGVRSLTCRNRTPRPAPRFRRGRPPGPRRPPRAEYAARFQLLRAVEMLELCLQIQQRWPGWRGVLAGRGCVHGDARRRGSPLCVTQQRAPRIIVDRQHLRMFRAGIDGEGHRAKTAGQAHRAAARSPAAVTAPAAACSRAQV